MSLKKTLTPPRMLTLQITCLSVLIGVGTVISPFIIRSVVDGFLLSQDRSAVMFALFVIATFETVSFGSDYIIRNKLNLLVESTLINVKKQVLSALLKKRVQPDTELFNRTWAVDIKRVVNHDMRQRWLRYKDIFLISLMSFVLMNLSVQAGMFIVLIGALQFGLAAWESKRNRGDIYYIRQSEELEHQNLKKFLNLLPGFYDKNLVAGEVDRLHSLVEHSVSAQNLADRNRSFLWDLKTVSRGLLILGALAIAAFGGVDMSWAAGTFWALMMVIFRLANPLSSLAQWIFSEQAIESSRNRVSDLLLYLSDDAFQPTTAFQQFKNTIGKFLLQNTGSETSTQKIQVLLQASELDLFKNVVRQWSSRFLWGSVQILTSPLEKPNKSCSHCIYILDNQYLAEIDLSSILLVTPHVCVLTSVPLPEKAFDKNFLWQEEQEKFIEVMSEPTQLPPHLTEIVRNQSTEWREAFRDLKMYCKLGVPFEFMLIQWSEPISKGSIAKQVRDVDHVVMGPNGLAVILLIGSDGLGSHRVVERLNKMLSIQCQEIFTKLIQTNRENWQQSLQDVEHEMTAAVFNSHQAKSQEVA